MAAAPIVLIDGRAPLLDELAHLALVNDGHFSTMQVRVGGVRGLQLHLDRLVAAHRELYDTQLDGERILTAMDAATAEHPDCSLRVTVFRAEDSEPRVMTAVRPARSPRTEPARLQTQPWTRAIPSIKHVGTFPQLHAARTAERAGYEDAVLTDTDGNLLETTIANLAFVRDDEVVWTDGAALLGTTWQLLERALPDAGFTTNRAFVKAAHLEAFTGAVVANSSGVSPVGSIDDHEFATSVRDAERLDEVFCSLPADSIAAARGSDPTVA